MTEGQGAPEKSAEAQSWEADAQIIAGRKKAQQEASAVEAGKWQGEINILMGRANHPENDVEYIDLDTGKVVPAPAENAIAMPLYYSKASQDELEATVARREAIMREITVLIESVAKNPAEAPLANHRVDELKGELGARSRTLYALLTANPIITEEWLAENRDKWRPRDLNTLIGRWERRNMEVVIRLRAFRLYEIRNRMGGVSTLDADDVGTVVKPR